MMEDKIINDVLIHLDGWELQNKDHKHRHKPHNHKMLDPFNETSEDVENTNIRKTVTAKEVLDMYEVAKIHVLNYIKRPVFPRTPVTHIALCMWTAGLLSQKARFRKEKVENSYNLISEAKKLLKTHVKHTPTIALISGSKDTLDCDIEHYRLPHHHHHPNCSPKKPHPCEMQHPHHEHKKHKHHHKPCHHHEQFEYDEPDFDSFFLKDNHIRLKVIPVYCEIEDTITLKAYVVDEHGNRVDGGLVRFYIEDDDEF